MLEATHLSRGSRGSRRGNVTSRGPGRGGIHKRSSTPVKVDRDGDLDMDASGRGRGRGRTNRSERGAHPSRPHPTKDNIDPSTMQRAITRAMNSGDAILRDGPRDRRGGLDQISVRGWKESKAASNPGGGITELLSFLERKATPSDSPASERVRIKKVCLSSCSAGHKRLSNFTLTGSPSFQAKFSERRPRYPWISAAAFG
jgi:nuclear RNA export factor